MSFLFYFLVVLVLWGWTLISWYWIWRSTLPISFTMPLSTSAPQFKSSTFTSMAPNRYNLHRQFPSYIYLDLLIYFIIFFIFTDKKKDVISSFLFLSQIVFFVTNIYVRQSSLTLENLMNNCIIYFRFLGFGPDELKMKRDYSLVSCWSTFSECVIIADDTCCSKRCCLLYSCCFIDSTDPDPNCNIWSK